MRCIEEITGAVIIRLLLLAVVIPGLAARMPAQTLEKSTQAVELKCRIIGSPEVAPRSFWLVELRDSLGRPVNRAIRMIGETIRFKNLIPGIYRIHLSGNAGRRRSESIDLNLPPEQRSLQVARDVKVPAATAGGAADYQVSVRSLAVPKEAQAQMQRAEKAQFEGDSEEMLHSLEGAIELYPEYAEAWNNLGAYYHRKGSFEQSIRCFTRVTELRPGFYVGWMNLGGSLLAVGKFRESLNANQKAATLGPDDATAVSQLGLSHYYLREYPQARKCFLRVINMDPGFPEAPQLFLAQIAISEKSYAEAEEYLQSFLELHPNAPNVPQVKQTLAAISDAVLQQDIARK